MTHVRNSRSARQRRRRVASSNGDLSGKKGIGMSGEDAMTNAIANLRPSWTYNWSPIRPSSQPDEIDFLPMIWGGTDVDNLLTKLETYIQPAIEAGTVQHVLSFNEPDNTDQSNMDVSDALTLWEYMSRTLDVPLVSPSCVHADGDWMQEFMNSSNNDDKLEWIGVHWYGGANSPATFQSKMASYYRLYERPLLITEFAPADWSASTTDENQYSQCQVLSFMKQVLPWLEQQDWIKGYAWFSFKQDRAVGTTSALLDSNGDPTMCGAFYASVNATNPYGDQSIGSGVCNYYSSVKYSMVAFVTIVATVLLVKRRRRTLRLGPATTLMKKRLIGPNRANENLVIT